MAAHEKRENKYKRTQYLRFRNDLHRHGHPFVLAAARLRITRMPEVAAADLVTELILAREVLRIPKQLVQRLLIIHRLGNAPSLLRLRAMALHQRRLDVLRGGGRGKRPLEQASRSGRGRGARVVRQRTGRWMPRRRMAAPEARRLVAHGRRASDAPPMAAIAVIRSILGALRFGHRVLRERNLSVVSVILSVALAHCIGTRTSIPSCSYKTSRHAIIGPPKPAVPTPPNAPGPLILCSFRYPTDARLHTG